MKKVVIIIMILAMLLGGCNFKSLAIERSKRNFKACENAIIEITNRYGLEIREEFDENIDSYKFLLIKINENSQISVWMIMSGKELLSIRYESINKNDNFDVEFFVKIVNAISGKKVTKNFIQDFLDAPEEDFSPLRYGIGKSENQLVFKHEFLNWWADYAISYELDTNMTETLYFQGLTKRLRNKG